MASHWLAGEVRRVIGVARTIHADVPAFPLWLHYRRGLLQVSRERHLIGMEPAIRMPLPMDRTDNALCEWMTWELRSVPCHPELGG